MEIQIIYQGPDKVHIFIFIMPISSPNPTFDQLLESSRWDDSNKWSNIGFSQEIMQVESIEVEFRRLIWSSVSVDDSNQLNLRTNCCGCPDLLKTELISFIEQQQT